MKSKSVFNIQMPRANAKQMTNTIPHYVENVLTEKSGDWQKKERKKKKKKQRAQTNDGRTMGRIKTLPTDKPLNSLTLKATTTKHNQLTQKLD